MLFQYQYMSNKHPKSLVHEYISQHPDQKINITIDFDHKFQQKTNTNIYRCRMIVNFADQIVTIDSDSANSKKDAEKDAYNKLLNHIETQSTEQLIQINQVNQVSQVSQSKEHTKPTQKVKVTDNRRSSLCSLPHTQVTPKEPVCDSTSSSDDIDLIDLNTTDTVVIVDYENVSKESEIIKLEKYIKGLLNGGTSIRIVKIAGHFSTVKKSADIVVISNRNDAVDHYISYYIGRLEATSSTKHTYVITRDKFGSCLQDFCNNVTHVPSVDDFIDDYNNAYEVDID